MWIPTEEANKLFGEQMQENENLDGKFIPPANVDIQMKVRMRTKKNWKKILQNLFKKG